MAVKRTVTVADSAKAAPKPRPKKAPTAGSFKPGHAKKGGRAKGTPNKVTKQVKDAVIEAFHNAGGVEYLQRVAKDDPKTFLTLLGKVIPAEVHGKVDGNITVNWPVPKHKLVD